MKKYYSFINFKSSSYKNLNSYSFFDKNKKKISGNKKQLGFNIIEMMVTLAVIAVLVAFATPSAQNLITSNKVATNTNEMITAFNLARIEAIKNGRGSGICASSNGTSCGDNWSAGYIVWEDTNEDGAFNADERVIRVAGGQNGFISEATEDIILFDYKGRRRGSENIDVVFEPERCNGANFKRIFTVEQIGRITVEKEKCE